MIRGLYTSGLGMMTQMNKMDVITNNIANVDTTGYKKDIVVTQSFSEELMKRLNDSSVSTLPYNSKVGGLSMGVFIDSIHTDFANGSLTVTNSSLDLAILGDGFFSVNVEDKNGNIQEKYTRGGNFTISDGKLATKDGYLVVGEKGNINIPKASIVLDDQGNIYADGEFVDKLKITDFEDKTSLKKNGDNLYERTELSKEKPFSGTVSQGSLERSNVNTVKEMVEMITVNRAYEANQRLLTVHDTILNRVVNDLGRKQ